jgi:hypothetical protein
LGVVQCQACIALPSLQRAIFWSAVWPFAILFGLRPIVIMLFALRSLALALALPCGPKHCRTLMGLAHFR